VLQRSYEKKREWMDQHGLCVWNGEFGPVYARKQFDGERTDEINEQRYQVLKDQLALYNKVGFNVWVLNGSMLTNSPGPTELVRLTQAFVHHDIHTHALIQGPYGS
jgi:hypothetical protein